VHFRDHEVLPHTVPATARHFGRALAMPNLTPPLTTISALIAYRERILTAASATPHFNPYLTLYLNEHVSLDTLVDASRLPFVLGAKLYPQGVTTHSEHGAKSIKALYPAFELMQAQGLTLQVHGEMLTGDIFDREAAFIEQELKPLCANFPRLKIVFEHISTQEAVDFVLTAPAHIAATITAHHLLYNRNQLLSGGIKPHYYCLPILKHARHQHALVTAATSGNPKFFAGTDSAPHAKAHKEQACGCAGIFTAPYAVALYASVFDEQHCLEKLEGFLSVWGADFYQLPRATSQIELRKLKQRIPKTLAFGKSRVVPIAAGSWLEWSINEAH
jgi:dihydroorotase